FLAIGKIVSHYRRGEHFGYDAEAFAPPPRLIDGHADLGNAEQQLAQTSGEVEAARHGPENRAGRFRHIEGSAKRDLPASDRLEAREAWRRAALQQNVPTF